MQRVISTVLWSQLKLMIESGQVLFVKKQMQHVISAVVSNFNFDFTLFFVLSFLFFVAAANL